MNLLSLFEKICYVANLRQNISWRLFVDTVTRPCFHRFPAILSNSSVREKEIQASWHASLDKLWKDQDVYYDFTCDIAGTRDRSEY